MQDYGKILTASIKKAIFARWTVVSFIFHFFFVAKHLLNNLTIKTQRSRPRLLCRCPHLNQMPAHGM